MARGAKPTCLCGACKKCKHREYVRARREARERTPEEIEASRVRQRAYYANNIEARRAAARQRIAENPGMSTERVRAWREENREYDNARQLAYYHSLDEEGKRRWRARGKVNEAIRKGDLKRDPCEVCGQPDAHGHHDDYDKPLEVRWLCPAHHAQHHAQERQAA